MSPDDERRAKALELAVQRFKGIPVSNVKAELIVAEAEIYDKFISGKLEDNSDARPSRAS